MPRLRRWLRVLDALPKCAVGIVWKKFCRAKNLKLRIPNPICNLLMICGKTNLLGSMLTRLHCGNQLLCSIQVHINSMIMNDLVFA